MNQGPSAGQVVNDAVGGHDTARRGARAAQGSLRDDLDSLLSGRRVLVMGVGNRLRADDALGPLLVDRFAGKLGVDVLDAGDVPENYLGPIEVSGAEVLLVLDAVDFGGRAGDVALLDASQLRETGLSTHAGSLNLLLQAMPVENRPSMVILAVQPFATGVGRGLSAVVTVALDVIERTVIELLGPTGTSTR